MKNKEKNIKSRNKLSEDELINIQIYKTLRKNGGPQCVNDNGGIYMSEGTIIYPDGHFEHE